jgi:hypothetical protein
LELVAQGDTLKEARKEIEALKAQVAWNGGIAALPQVQANDSGFTQVRQDVDMDMGDEKIRNEEVGGDMFCRWWPLGPAGSGITL